MKSILAVLAVLAGSLAWFYTLQFFRFKAMRVLASRWGFQYLDRALPASFSLTCDPFDCIARVWNVIEGQRNGISVLVFDSMIRGGKGNYRTFIAVQTEKQAFHLLALRAPFARDGKLCSGKTAQGDGWTAFYRHGLWINIASFRGWTMSIQQIEDHLENLGF